MSGVRESAPGDFVVLGDVLDFHRGHLPGTGLTPHPDRDDLDDCLLTPQRHVRQFEFSGPEQWVNYGQILDVFVERKRAGAKAHTWPFRREVVFAPIKLVLAETDNPLRAVLTYSPVYPGRGKIATLRAGQSVWMAYAALGVLNCAIGQAYYLANLRRMKGLDRCPHGPRVDVLSSIPVAVRGYRSRDLREVARLAYQVSTLHEAAVEVSIARERIPTMREHLNRAICFNLLRMTDPQPMLETVRGMGLPELPIVDSQTSLFDPGWQTIQTPPPRLMSPEDETRWAILRENGARGLLTRQRQRDFERIRNIAWWQELLLHELPEFILTGTDIVEPSTPSVSLSDLSGVTVPVQLVREERAGYSYEYYPLGEHVVLAPGVSGNRMTFKGTRIDVRYALDELAAGATPEQVSADLGAGISSEAVEEAARLARMNRPEVFDRALVCEEPMDDRSR